MSSPFSAFRKYKKGMFAVLILVAMFAFIFGDMILGRGSNGGQGQNPVVVEWNLDHGPLKQIELQNTTALLTQFNTFLRFLSGMPAGQITSERDAVNILLLSRLAEQRGMAISDAAIRTILRSSLAGPDGQPVTTAQMQQALHAVRLSEYQLFSVLRMWVLANNMRQLFLMGHGVDTPVQRWEHYNRIERKVKADLVEVKAADHVSKVADPDNATLEKFFTAHKNKYPTVPYENYLRSMAAGQKWSDEYAPAGEPGFKQQYRAEFQYIKLPRSTFVDEAAVAVTDKEIADYYEKEKDNKFKALELPKDEKPADEKKEEAKPGDAAKPDATTTDAAKTDAAKADAAKTADTDAKPAADAPAKSPYEPLDKVKDTIRKALADERASQKMDETLARLKQAMDNYTLLRDDWKAKLFDDKNAPEPTPPSLSELATAEKGTLANTDLATAFDLAQKYDLGKSFNLVQVPTQIPGFMRTERRSIIQTLYQNPDGVEEYKAQESEDEDGNRYIYWKTKQEAPRVPELAQVRDKVVDAWKLIEARKLALAEANQLADKARAAPDKPFKEIFPDRKVIETNEFSWLTPNLMAPNAPPSLSTVDGVPEPGEEFMRVVTQLNIGQVGVAPDYSKNDDYVARVTATAYTPDAYRSLFLTNIRDYPKYSHAGAEAWDGMYTSWLNQLKSEVGYKELRPLDRGPKSQGQEEEGDAE